MVFMVKSISKLHQGRSKTVLLQYLFDVVEVVLVILP